MCHNMNSAQTNSPALWQHYVRAKSGDVNKYAYGHAVVFGGARLTGAACLAGHAALKVGAGLCTIAAPATIANVYRAYMPEIMVEERDLSVSFKANFSD